MSLYFPLHFPTGNSILTIWWKNVRCGSSRSSTLQISTLKKHAEENDQTSTSRMERTKTTWFRMFLKLHRTRPEVELVKIVKLEQSLLMQVPKECSLVSCAMFVGDEACRHEPCFKHVAREFDYGDSLSQDRWNRQSQLLTYPRAVGGKGCTKYLEARGW